MPEVGLQLNDGTFYGRKGRIETVSGVVNATTRKGGANQSPPNPDRELLSGTIGNIVPARSGCGCHPAAQDRHRGIAGQDYRPPPQKRKGRSSLLTVDRLNDGNHFVVNQGVSVGDTIITEGVGLVKEGMIVTPKNVTP